MLHLENIRKQYKNNKIKIIAPTWSDDFVSPNGSYSISDIQGYTEFIIKKHQKLTRIPLIYVIINKANIRLLFKTKDGCNLEIQMSETMNYLVLQKIDRQSKKRRTSIKSWSSWTSFSSN